MTPGLECAREAALLTTIREGSRDASEHAFREVFLALRENVFALCLHLTGNRTEAEDALQEVFWAVHRGLRGFRGESRLSTWVHRIAIHTALRTRARRRPMIAQEASTVSASPEDLAARREDIDRVRYALDRLSSEHRTVLSLFAIDGLSHQEIADILGVPKGTVWSRLHLARTRLREEMGR
jgi:RNA polymerase sigma-70 factor, ECF subfamily